MEYIIGLLCNIISDVRSRTKFGSEVEASSDDVRIATIGNVLFGCNQAADVTVVAGDMFLATSKILGPCN